MIKADSQDISKSLVQKCQNGDMKAFKELYDTYKGKVHSIALYMAGNENDAAEITQQVFISVYKYIGTFEFRSSIYTWITRLAINTSLNFLKSAPKRRFVSLEKVDGTTNVTGDLGSDNFENKIMISAEVRKAIYKLKPKLRTIAILKYVHDLSYSEISDILECSVGTVCSSIYRCNQFLRKELKYLVE